MKILAIDWRGFALLQTVIADNAGNPQSIIAKQVIATSLLRATVLFEIAPGADSGLVTPEGQRQQFAGLTQTFKSFDRYESIDFAQLGPERSGDWNASITTQSNPASASIVAASSVELLFQTSDFLT